MSLVEAFRSAGMTPRPLYVINLKDGSFNNEAFKCVCTNECVMAYLDGGSVLTFSFNGELSLIRVTEPGGAVLKPGATNLLAELFQVKFVDNP